MSAIEGTPYETETNSLFPEIPQPLTEEQKDTLTSLVKDFRLQNVPNLQIYQFLTPLVTPHEIELAIIRVRRSGTVPLLPRGRKPGELVGSKRQQITDSLTAYTLEYPGKPVNLSEIAKQLGTTTRAWVDFVYNNLLTTQVVPPLANPKKR